MLAVPMPVTLRRRQLVASGALAAGALAFGPGFWRQALAAEDLTAGDGPYGPLRDPDENGLRLPEGFSSRIVAESNQPVVGRDAGAVPYRWPIFPDGQATFAVDDGGWILVTNSEALFPDGGSSAIRFDADGEILSAYRILVGTSVNCAGGPTPWGTWLSCEEYDGGRVWECDPTRTGTGIVRPAMGTFNHEAVAVDPDAKRLYMTEDEEDGGFYRFTPDNYPDLSMGKLEIAVLDCEGETISVSWEEVENPLGVPPTRDQVDGAAQFDGGEGIWFDSGLVYFSTKGDNVIRAYDTSKDTLEVIYDRSKVEDAPLSGLDNLTVTASGDLYVCEDGGDLDIGIITPDREVARFLKLTGSAAEGSELAGVIFNPEGDRMYFNSQRGETFGITYEVRGPFREGNGSGPRGPVLSCGETPGDGGEDDGDPDRDEDDVRADDGRGLEGGRDVRRRNRDRDDDDDDNGGGSDGAAPPAAAGGDVDAPGLLVLARRSLSLASLADGGLNVDVRLDEPGEVKVVLRTGDLARVPGARGSSPRPRTVTLARAALVVPTAGTYIVNLRPSRRMTARLRRARRPVAGRVTAQATDRAGNVAIATRGVRVPAR